MSRIPLGPVLTTVVAAALTAQDPPVRHRVLDPATRATLVELMGRAPLDALRDLGLGKPDPTRDRWVGKGTPTAVVIAVDRAALVGLWSTDRAVARGAASLLSEHQLDAVDIERYQDLVVPLLFGDDDPQLVGRLTDIDDFKHTLSARRLAHVLTLTPPVGSEYRQCQFSELHRSIGPANLPQLCRLTHHRDPMVRRQAMSLVCTASQYTDRHRELVARTMLEWPGPVPFDELTIRDPRAFTPHAPRQFELPAAGVGYPPLLAAVLLRSAREAWPPQASWPRTMPFRWAVACTAGPKDRDLLFELLRAERPGQQYLRLVAIGGLGQLDDERSGRVLDRHARSTRDSTERALCLAALVRRGVATARVELARLARTDGQMLAAAGEVMPAVALAQWSDRAFHRDPAIRKAAVRLLEDAESHSRYGPFRWAPATREAIAAAIEQRRQRLDAADLGQLLEVLPECRTRAVAQTCLAALRPADLAGCQLAFLQVSDESALRRRLAGWLADDADRPAALASLLRLGAPAHGAALLGYWQTLRSPSPFVLARSGGSEAVTGFLRDRVVAAPVPAAGPAQDRSQALAALAMVHGLPEPVARALPDAIARLAPAVVRKRWPEWRTAVLAGRPVEMLLAILRAGPPERAYLPRLGMVRDPRVLAFLREVRGAPGSDVQWAVGELAVAGDPAARQEMRLVLERRYYGWADDASAQALGLGLGLELVPYWLGEIESNCCRKVAAAKVLEELCGHDVDAAGSEAPITQQAAALRWWQRFRAQLVWSPVAGHYVIGPR